MSNTGGRPPRDRRERFRRSDAQSRDLEGDADLRRTQRLDLDEEADIEQEPLNPNWRRRQTTTRGRSGRAGVPSSPQDIQIWLQRGGWRYIAAVAALFIIALIGILVFNQNVRDASNPDDNPFMAGSQPTTVPTGLLPPTVTSAPTTPTAVAPRFFVVTGTGVEGLFLRPDHSAQNQPIATLPEGTRVEQIGEDVTGEQYVWRKVRAPDGQEGWVAVDFLRPAQ